MGISWTPVTDGQWDARCDEETWLRSWSLSWQNQAENEVPKSFFGILPTTGIHSALMDLARRTDVWKTAEHLTLKQINV